MRARLPSPQVLAALAATLAAMVSFQIGAAAAKGIFPDVGPLGAATLRLALAALLLNLILRPWRNWPTGARLAPVLILGVAMSAAIPFFFMAISRMPLGVVMAIQFLGPLAVATFGSRRPRDLLWAALAGAGVWLMLGVAADRRGLDLIGVGCALGAACCWAGYIVWGRRASAQFGPRTAALAVSVAALLVIPLGVATAGPALFDPRLLPIALLLGVLSSALPFSLELFAMPKLPIRTFAVFTSLEPAIAVLSGLVLLQERLSLAQSAGVACVIAAAAGAAWTAGDKAPLAPPID